MTTPAPRIGVVVLAGGRVPRGLAHLCTHRALLRIGDRPMLYHVASALAGVPDVVGIVSVLPEDALPHLGDIPGAAIAAGASIVENMRRGARHLAPQRPSHLLFVTGDVPLLTAEAVHAYVDASLATGAALTYPIIPREVSEARFPGGRRTYVRIQEGSFTGGNAIFTTATLLDDKGTLIEELYNARKSPLKLAGILGWGTVARMLTGRLDLPYLEGVAARILGARVAAVITPYAEIGFDVDKAEDLAALGHGSWVVGSRS